MSINVRFESNVIEVELDVVVSIYAFGNKINESKTRASLVRRKLHFFNT